MDMAYTYDSVGNITALANNADVPFTYLKGGRTAFTFQYDDLYQLTGSTGEFQKQNSTADKFTLSMTYDTIHNITRKNQLAFKQYSNGSRTPNVRMTYDSTYTYAARLKGRSAYRKTGCHFSG